MSEVLAKPRKKRQINPDRIVLSKESLNVVAILATQIEAAFGGVIRLGGKDIVNFLVQARCEEFTKEELEQIREKHFDEVRAAQWALARLNQAKESGETTTLMDILSQIQSPAVGRAHQKRKRTANKHASKNDECKIDTMDSSTSDDQQLNR